MKSMLRLGLLALFISVLSGCSGSDGAAGPAGAAGTPGATGTPGTNGLGITVTDVHGAARSTEATRGPNNAANPFTTITAASVDASGKLVVDFKVTTDAAGANPYTTAIPASSVRFSIAMLRAFAVPAPGTGYQGDSSGDSTYWVNYINTSKVRTTAIDPETGSPYGTTAAGFKMNQPGQETATAGTLTNNGNGTYHYVSAVTLTNGIDISANNTNVSILPNGGVYPYNAANTHRVGIQLSDPDGTGPATMGANNAIFNFVPNGGALVTREVVDISNCNNACHKTLGLHGGGRLDTKLCVTCHNPTNGDPESGNVLDFKVMVHKIHTAKRLPSVALDKAGDFNSLYKADPEGAIKGTPYVIWGFNNTKVDFSEVLIPANPANCTVCHKNAVDADNWKTKPTKEACGSCHDGINFATGTGTRMWYPDSKITMTDSGGTAVNRTNVAGFGAAIALGHKGGAQTTNAACALCHSSVASATGRQSGVDQNPAIPDVHGRFSDSDPLGWSKVNVDFSINLSVNTPTRGYFIAGEKPVVTIVLTDLAASAVVDHTTISEASGDFAAAASSVPMYGLRTDTVTSMGPPAVYTSAQKNVTVGGLLKLYVNGPRALRKPALTTAAVNKTFFSLTGAKYGNAENDLRIRTVTNAPMQDDVVSGVKATGVISRSDAGKLQYQLADVAGLAPGTYVAMLQATKRTSSTSVEPKSMSVAMVTFKVGQATDEKKVAYGCPDCHSTTYWHDNVSNGANGNHPAKFDPDYCASCHDYEAQFLAAATGVGATTLGNSEYKISFDSAGNEVFTVANFPAGSGQAWKIGGNNMGFSAAPIARRVHGVHGGGIKRANGTPLINYPYEIYNGENVSITFPQDVRNCEKCHNSTTSGTWKTKPSRVACLACHDSDAAYAHATLQTLDPTSTVSTLASSAVAPASGPYSGDEIESCPVCHAANP